MTSRFVSLCLAVVLAFAAAGARAQVTVRPAPIPIKGPDEIINPPFNLSEVDVDGILGAIELYTGRTVLRTQALPANTYTVNITRPIPKSELVLALETLLELNGVGITPLGDRFLKVVPLSLIKSEAPELITGSTLDMPPSGRIATKLFQLEFLRANEFFNVGLGAIFSPGVGGIGAGVVVLDKANAVIVTDTIANLQRIETLINELDHPSMTGMTAKFYVLKNGAKASDVVTKLKAMLTGAAIQAQLGTVVNFSADDRTNQIILLSDPRQQPFFDDLIAKLDVRSDPNTRNEVIRLKTADAETLVTQVLQPLLQAQSASTQRTAGQQSIPRPGEVGYTGQGYGQGFTGQNTQGGGTGTYFNGLQPMGGQTLGGQIQGGQTLGGQTAGGLPSLPTAPTFASTSAPAIASILGSGAGSAVFSPLATIVADERTNAVVISGTADDIDLLKQLIAKLDVVLPQVRIEVVIAEVQLSDTDISGLSALGLTVGTGGSHGTSIQNFSGSVAGWDVTSGVVNPLSFQAALNAASAGTKNIVHILQAPIIMATHNKPAEITVGDEIPEENGGTTSPITGGTSTSTSVATTFTVSTISIVLDLKITPLIGDDGSVQLTVDQKVDDQDGAVVINGNSTPIIDHREAISYVTVQDNQMIVLGGLQKTSKSSTHNKLGLLYEIPILSQLLGGHTDDLERDELLLFIRPHIVRPEDSTADTRKKINELSNRADVNQYLVDPTPKPNSKAENMEDRFKSD
jgi:general secretion pathway protein D